MRKDYVAAPASRTNDEDPQACSTQSTNQKTASTSGGNSRQGNYTNYTFLALRLQEDFNKPLLGNPLLAYYFLSSSRDGETIYTDSQIVAGMENYLHRP